MQVSISSFARHTRRALALTLAFLGLVFVMTMSLPVEAMAGQVTVTGNNATDYQAYQVFDADVADGKASNIEWVNGAQTAVESASGQSFSTAQEAADWLTQNLTDGNDVDYALAKALVAEGQEGSIKPVALTAGKATELSEGYWLIVCDDSKLGESQAGTAPVFVLVGSDAQSIAPKSAVPTVAKHVQENSTGTWQKAADATVGDDVLWRLEATVPAGLQGYSTYNVWFEDQLSDGLDSSKVASSARVYVRLGTGSSWDDASSGTTDADPTNGWRDVTDQCEVTVAGQSFEVRSPDLVKVLGSDDSQALATQGAQVCVIYNAPLNQRCNHGAAQGNPNTVHLEYPKSPLHGDQRLKTPDDKATAYTWDVLLTKRSSLGDAVLSGALLDVVDPQGRHLRQDGSWGTDASTVTTDERGRVSLSGVDSGTYLVSEVKAPEGYQRFDGTRQLVLTVSGLDVAQVASAHPTIQVSAQSPLRADSVDGSTSQVQASVLNTPETPGQPGTPTTPTSTSGSSPKMGDSARMALALIPAALGAVLVIVAVRARRRED
ncbi:MAG: isopeptide-forming domain-containing fimbrial protein [Atopobiaceae bacterium]